MTQPKMELADWLDDLCVRFIINLPQEELESVERICFQVEEAQWFYEDFIRPLDPSLPSLNLRDFCLLIFKHCPLLSAFSSDLHAAAFSEFLAYKTRVPVRGAIMLNDAMDRVVLVKGWKKGASWSFPRGKINKGENDLDCAVREVYEETGYDIRAAGLVRDESEMNFIEVTMREQHMRLYIFRGVPEDTHFEPRTRKEISKIQWCKLSDLPGFKKSGKRREGNGENLDKPNKFYMVAPFLAPLKRWIAEQCKFDAKRMSTASIPPAAAAAEGPIDEEAPPLEDEKVKAETFVEEQAAGDFDQLLANLRASCSTIETSLSEETAIQKTPADTATQLKRLLNVGIPAIASQPAATVDVVKSSALLAMLHSRPGNTLPSGPPQAAFAPITTTDRIDQVPLEPLTAQHHNQRPPPTLNLAAPPSTPLSLHAQQPTQESNAAFRYHNSHLLHNGFSVHEPLPTGFDNQLPIHLRQKFSATNYSGPSLSRPPSQPHARGPYRSTGDPQFAQTHRGSNHNGPVVPHASNLPQPTLTNHTLNLLSVFKSHEKPAPSDTISPSEVANRTAVKSAMQGPANAVNAAAQTRSAEGTPSTALHAPRLPILHETYRQTVGTGTMGKRRVINVSKSTHNPDSAMPSGSPQAAGLTPAGIRQQAALGATSTRMSSLKLRPASIAPSIRRTKGHSQPESNGQHQVASRGQLAPVSSATKAEDDSLNRGQSLVAAGPDARSLQGMKIVKRPIIAPSEVPLAVAMLPTAAVSDMRSLPLPVPQAPRSMLQSGFSANPDVETLAREGRLEGDHVASAFRPESQMHCPRPITILARPTQLKSQTPLTRRGGATEAVPSLPREQRKDFKPHILRRPTPTSYDASTAHSTVGAFIRPKSVPRPQAQDLLSLFTRSTDAVSPEGPSPVHSNPTLSITADKILPLESRPMQASRSRLGSLASAVSNETATGMQRSISGTPVTPSDKSFLLGYLEGVVKGAK